MAWDFSTEPEFAKKLDWIREFVREEVEPLEVLFPGCEFLPLNEQRRTIVDPLKQQVREQGLWAPHLGPELGGQGFGAVKLTLINEILGRSPWAPIVFGTQAPDTGNAEIIARFGTQDQKDRYLSGLLSGEIFSCFSMTEPQGGADPRVFTTRAVRDGDDWVITGRKSRSPTLTWRCITAHRRSSSRRTPPASRSRRTTIWSAPTRTSRAIRWCTTTTYGCRRRRCSASRARAF
jgi:acyl-CoA dehydrogenase